LKIFVNLGEKLQQYSLDAICEHVLKLKKIEYKSKNVSLDDLYINDPSEFLLYNIGDTLLTKKLNDKLKHIELYNMIRRNMYTSISQSMNGSSPLFESIIYYNLMKDNKIVRFGINNESGKTIEEKDLEKFPQLLDTKKGKIKPVKISSKTWSEWTSKFTGAYVKQPTATIINDGSLLIDMDAVSLYPSVILQSNISFDSYKARVLPPTVYKTLILIQSGLTKKTLPNTLPENISTLIDKYIKREDPTQKGQTRTTLY
jgi:DNA polymerase elongation subunit (family B)